MITPDLINKYLNDRPKTHIFLKNIFYLRKNQCPNNTNNTAAVTSSCTVYI